jgi:predicted transcriptional regulator
MSKHRLKIGIRGANARSGNLRETFQRVARGDRSAREAELYFENIDELRRMLTPKRLELLLAITRESPGSVQALAGILRRDYKNVSTDVALLERLGLIKLSSRSGKGRSQAPSVPYDEILVTIDLRNAASAHAA